MDIDYLPNIQFTPIAAIEGSNTDTATQAVTPMSTQYAGVINQTQFFSVDDAISRVTTLQAANNLTGIYKTDVNAALANSQAVLNAQYAYIGNDEAGSFNGWTAAMHNWQSLEDTCSDLLQQLPWLAVAYPEDYLDYSDLIDEYNSTLQQSNDALATFQGLSTAHFSVADVVNVQNSFLDSLARVFNSNATGASSSGIESYITGALQNYQSTQQAQIQSKYTLTYRMTNAARQTKVSNVFLTSQASYLSLTPNLRLTLMNADVENYTRELEDLAGGVDEDYATRLLDLYKTYSIYTDSLSALTQLGGSQ
jgi:hypothetical protein